MKPNKRFLWGAIAVALVCFAAAIGVTVFYNETHQTRGLERASFQALFLTLQFFSLLAALAAMWATATARDEVARAADRVSVFWGWTIGAFVWCMTPWLSLPEALVEPLSNPDGDTLFTLSEAAGAYMGGGLVLILLVSACSSIIKVCWWLAKR